MRVQLALVDTTVNKMDGTKEVLLRLDAQDEIDGFIGKNRPSLGIRFSKHRPEIFIHVGEPFQSDYGEFDSTSVRVKFDEGAPRKQTWTEATNHEAAFAANPGIFLRKLLASRTLLFEFTPFEKRETTVSFETGDLKEKIEPVSSACGVR